MTDFRIITLMSALVAFPILTAVFAESTTETTQFTAYQAQRQEIETLGKEWNVPALIAATDEVDRSWRTRSMVFYGRLMVDICGILRSECGEHAIPYDEIRLVAQKALDTYDPNKEDNISVETHYRLTAALQERSTYWRGMINDEAWTTKRSIEAKRWMIPWDRMEAAIDPNFDPSDKPLINVSPPLETELSPGVSPEAITTPTLRLQYEKDIEANARKTRYRHEQRGLRRLRAQFTHSLVHFFGSTYSVSPYNDTELKDLLDQHVKDEKVRELILKAVEEKKPKT